MPLCLSYRSNVNFERNTQKTLGKPTGWIRTLFRKQVRANVRCGFKSHGFRFVLGRYQKAEG